MFNLLVIKGHHPYRRCSCSFLLIHVTSRVQKSEKGSYSDYSRYGYGSIPTNTIFSGMNIHLPAILMFTRGTRF